MRQTLYVADGDAVVVIGAYRARSKKTGRNWDTSYAHIAKVKSGTISKFSLYFDTAACATAHKG